MLKFKAKINYMQLVMLEKSSKPSTATPTIFVKLILCYIATPTVFIKLILCYIIYKIYTIGKIFLLR